MMNKHIPKVRFSGFNEEWVQYKLAEISEKVTEKNRDVLYSETLTNSAEFGIINQRDYFKKDISNVKNLDGYYVVRPNDFVYNPRISNFAPVGPIKRNKLGRTGVMSPLYRVFRPHDINYTFLEQYFSSSKWHNFMRLNGDSGARSDRFAIKDSEFQKMPIPVPCREEQARISRFFKKINEDITSYQQELTILKQTKQGFLQKMFPKEGESVPEVRFPGFTHAWEQRMLKDVATYIRGSFPQPYTNPDFYDEENGKPFVQVADIGFDLKLNASTKAHISKLAEPKSRFVEAGKVVVALQGSIERSIGRTAITQYDAYFDRTILIFEDYKVPIDKQYFAQVIRKLFEHEKEKAWGATISTITKGHLNDFIIGIPFLEEQQKIGSFFKQLDNTIALHQRELDYLKETENAFLQKMFV